MAKTRDFKGKPLSPAAKVLQAEQRAREAEAALDIARRLIVVIGTRAAKVAEILCDDKIPQDGFWVSTRLLVRDDLKAIVRDCLEFLGTEEEGG